MSLTGPDDVSPPATPAAEAHEQTKRLRTATGAAIIGGVGCFMLPVVGGVTLACVGAAAAAAATTRADELGEAARASGAATASGLETISKTDVAGKARRLYGSVRARVAGTPADEEPAASKKKKKQAPPQESSSWLARTVAAWTGPPAPSRLDTYGELRSAADAAERMTREELAATPHAVRRRLALEIIASLHPDRATSVGARATATALTRVAIQVRDFFDNAGWDVIERRGLDAVVADVKKSIDRI
mmetsp:Transcript_23434/g.92883  ORF Transcript_23434/g.92883 Transcript_23434/m.92883 type:complete len:247 (+) Transcript_23434:67-807(+)